MTEATATEANKGGAPPGNTNRQTHGLRSWAALGRFPAGASYVRRQCGRLRAVLEADVLDLDGQITVYQAALIQSACRHEGRALLLTRYLRDAKNPTLADQLAVMKEIGAATDSRDKCLQRLGIDRLAKGVDPWEVLTARAGASAPPAISDASQPTESGKDA
jgi:hypothetical protein